MERSRELPEWPGKLPKEGTFRRGWTELSIYAKSLGWGSPQWLELGGDMSQQDRTRAILSTCGTYLARADVRQTQGSMWRGEQASPSPCTPSPNLSTRPTRVASASPGCLSSCTFCPRNPSPPGCAQHGNAPWGGALRSHAPWPRPSSRSASEPAGPPEGRRESPPDRPASPLLLHLCLSLGVCTCRGAGHGAAQRGARPRASRGAGGSVPDLFSLTGVQARGAQHGEGRRKPSAWIQSPDSCVVLSGHVAVGQEVPRKGWVPCREAPGRHLLPLPSEDAEGTPSLCSCEAAAPEDARGHQHVYGTPRAADGRGRADNGEWQTAARPTGQGPSAALTTSGDNSQRHVSKQLRGRVLGGSTEAGAAA